MHFIEVSKALFKILADRSYNCSSLAEHHSDHVMTLESEGQCSHIIQSADIARNILAQNNIVPLDLTKNLRRLEKQINVDLSPIISFLNNSPVILSGKRHDLLKRSCLEFLRGIHPKLDSFIPSKAAECISRLADSQGKDKPFDIIAQCYIDPIIERTAHLLNCKMTMDCQHLPSSIFEVFPAPARLARTSRMIGGFLEHNGCELNVEYNKGQHLDPFFLLTFILMGREPLISALTSTLLMLNQQDEVSANEKLGILFAQATPVNILTRQVATTITIHDHEFKQGDNIFIVLPTINGYLQLQQNGKNMMPFGLGKHVCPGKSLSGTILEQFVHACSSNQANLISQEQLSISPSVFLKFS